jgi:hypothetical protein
MSKLYYYTTNVNVGSIFSSFSIIPEDYCSKINFGNRFPNYLSDLNGFRHYIPLFKKHDYSFDLSKNPEYNVSLLCLELNIDLKNNRNVYYFKKSKDNLIECENLRSSDIILIGDALRVDDNLIKKIYFNDEDSLIYTRTQFKLTKEIKSSNHFIKKFQVNKHDPKPYPFSNVSYKKIKDINLRIPVSQNIEDVCFRDGYYGLLLGLDYFQSIENNPSIGKFKYLTDKIVDYVALRNPLKYSELIDNHFSELSSIISNYAKVDNKHKKLYTKLDEYSINPDSTKTLSSAIDDLIKKIAYKNINYYKYMKKVLNPFIREQSNKFKEKNDADIIDSIKGITESQKFISESLRDDQAEYLSNLIGGREKVDFSKINIILSRAHISYSALMLSTHYPGKFKALIAYEEKEVSLLKDFFFQLNKQIRKSFIKESSKYEYLTPFKIDEECEDKSLFIRNEDSFKLDDRNEELFQEIINILAQYCYLKDLPKSKSLTEDDKNLIIKYIYEQLSHREIIKKEDSVVEDLRNINKYFKNPIQIKEIENSVIDSLYKFLLQPSDIERLLLNVNSSQKKMMIVVFWGVYNGFTQIDKNIYNIAIGSRKINKFFSRDTSNEIIFSEKYLKSDEVKEERITKNVKVKKADKIIDNKKIDTPNKKSIKQKTTTVKQLEIETVYSDLDEKDYENNVWGKFKKIKNDSKYYQNNLDERSRGFIDDMLQNKLKKVKKKPLSDPQKKWINGIIKSYDNLKV